MKLWEDPRVARGLRAQLELRRTRLAGGDAALGWKVGFGAPAMLQLLQISGPLIGFLTQKARVQSGASVSLAGWAKPVAEPEIAVHIGTDVPAGADAATARAAIAGISPAIELVDLTTPPVDPEKILAGNIYQRHVVLGGTQPARAGASAEGLDLPHHPPRQRDRAHGRSAGQHRTMGGHRAARRQRARGLRRAAEGRRDHHHRLGGAAAHHRARRERHRLRGRLRSAACPFASPDEQTRRISA